MDEPLPGLHREVPISTHPSSLAEPSSQPVILIVDDDAMVLNMLDLMFQRKGFQVLKASHGQDAVNVYRQEHARIAVVLLDVCMLGLDGPQTLAELQRIHPGVVACFMSGHTGEYTPQDLLQRGASRFFPKPFRMEETIQELWQLTREPARLSA